MKNPQEPSQEPLAEMLEMKSEVDGFDSDATEWVLIDPKTKITVAVIIPVNDEGERYAKKLMEAYNQFAS